MFNFFRVKKQIQIELEEYIAFKARSSPFIAQDQNRILTDFIKEIKRTNVSEITLEELDIYHNRIKKETTPYTTIKIMEAIRAFLRFHKAKTDIKASIITNRGINLHGVEESAIIVPMKRKKNGRPFKDVELIKQVKRLKDREKLTFRKIGLVIDKDVSHVFRMYRYKLD